MRIALLTLLAIIGLQVQICYADCKLDSACVYAVRSTPLHPATLGEALDARRAVDIACRDYHACIKQEEEKRASEEKERESEEAHARKLADENPTVRAWRKRQAMREAQKKKQAENEAQKP
jgi:hypothetical protein